MYVPMDLIQKCMEGYEELGLGSIFAVVTAWLPEDMSGLFTDEDSLIDFVTTNNFLRTDLVATTGDNSLEIYEKFNKLLIERSPQLVEILGVKLADLKSGKVDLITEYRDTLLAPAVFSKWSKHKQVYKPDKDFAVALMKTEKLTLSKDMLSHLPFRIFYIDMSELGVAIHGAFVNVAVQGDMAYVTIFLVTRDLVYFSHYISAGFDEEGNAFFERSEIRNEKPYVLPSMMTKETMKNASSYDFDRQDLATLIMQMLAYISSSEPQIVESASTKHSYKPHKHGDTVKNKWSELQIFEVGYAYGNAFRKKIAKARAEVDDEIEMLSSDQIKHRKSPRPYIRCAHWQRFRYGEGRKFLSEPRWMEPILVGFGDLDDNTPIATVHRVKAKK